MSGMNHNNNQILQEMNGSQVKPACPECGSYEPWGLSSWCPQCGFYPALGKCVGQPELHEQEETKPQPQTVWELIPEWGWVLAIGTIAAIGLSVGGRFFCKDSAELCLWTLTQASVGLIMFLFGHILAYLTAVSKSVEFGLMSIILTPLKIWRPTIRRFPYGAWKLDLAVWGLTLMVGAFVIVGGFEFNSLFQDWGVRKSADVNLVASIVDQAKETDGGANNLEGALNDFAGGSDEAKKAGIPDSQAEPALKLPEFDCLLIGYTTLSTGKIDSVLIASSYNKRLVYAGTISTKKVPKHILEEWQTQLPALKQSAPFVKTKQRATWVKPKITFKVKSKGWTDTNHRLIKPQFSTLLQEVNVN
ncbi:ATP dependent DNA ligase [Gimesia aquarii]|uniref:DNA ligase (ATP) n=1 Tax=Gimesia aquarii TaxID=2527964 RepID=A0A517W4W9_9PLAN|nr:hypothetical protein [Gimesia aquarii]QDU00302.1 hypothetical protein V144x_58150 [Gimesia aquarii]